MPDVNMPEFQHSAAAGPRGAEPRAGRSNHGIWWTVLAVLLIAGGGAAWWSMRPAHHAAAAPPPMRVPVIVVTAHALPIYRSFPALTQAVRTVTIQARVTGYLSAQGAADGADVAAGDLLYRIDAKDYQLAFAQARATLGQASASLAYSSANNGRNQILAHQGWVSRDTADQSQSTFHQGQQSLANNTASLNQAALNLSRTEIRAPFSGRMSASQVFTGSLISVAGATLNTLVQLDPIYVSFNPAEANLTAITRAQSHGPVETTVADSGASSHTGPLTFVDNQVSLSTGTILVRATIANKNHGLLPGQYVTARLHLGDQADALSIPQSAVGSTQIGQTVMVVGKDSKAEQRIVTLGDSDGAMIVVNSGLTPGDRVITGQLQKLKPGATIEPYADTPGSH